LTRRAGFVWGVLGLAAGCLLLFAGAGPAAGAGSNLIPNGSFESGGSYSFSGWGLTTATQTSASDAEDGSWAAKVQPSGTTSSYGIFVKPQPVASATQGSQYVGSAWIRSDTPGKTVCVNLRDVASNGSLAQPAVKSCAATTSSWAQLTTPTMSVVNTGDAVGFTITQASAAAGDSFEADNASLVQAGSAPDTTPPSVPTNVHTTQVTASSVSLAWDASTDNQDPQSALTYDVVRNGTVLATTPAGQTSYTDAGVTAGTQYSYAIEAVDTSGNTSQPSSPPVSVTPSDDTSRPTAPTNLQASAIASTSVTLTWTASTDIDNDPSTLTYEVLNGGTVVDTTQAGATSDTLSGLTPSTQYAFTVEALDPAGNVSPASNEVDLTTLASDTTAPTTPANLHTTSVTMSSVSLAWTASTDGDDATSTLTYQVSRDGTVVATTAAGVTTYTDTGLTSGQQYTYAVTALDPAGNASQPTPLLPVTTTQDTTAPTTPTNVVATANGTSSVTVTWKASTDPDNASSTLTYDVYRYASLIGSVPGTSTLQFVDGSLQSGTSASYYVVARDPAGNRSAASKTAWTTTASAPTTVADWEMDEPAGSTTMIDSSPNGNNGTLTNVKAGVPGFAGTGYSFKPKAWVTVPDAPSLDPGYRNVSVTLHIMTTSLPSSGDFDLLRKGKSPGDVEYKVELLKSGQILCALHGLVGGTTFNGIGVQSTGAGLADGHWHTIVCARTGYGTVSLTVDGTQYTAVLSGGASLGAISPSEHLYIGANPDAGNDYYRGSADDVTVQVG
jgi:chitodextrinase